MTQLAKPYRTAYKKRDLERDTYLSRWTPKGILYCKTCGAVYYRRRWTLTPPADVRDSAEFGDGFQVVFCPGCRKIGDQHSLGELLLVEVAPEESDEILHLLRNAEERARANNPLERIIVIAANGAGWKVTTTTENLAQRLGRCLEKARGGKVTYKWSHNNKFARVLWEKRAKAAA
ncbi:MAG TPA: BCAM0308 family protein [Candidatus Binatia bacterium]|jgi:hypothetical protein